MVTYGLKLLFVVVVLWLGRGKRRLCHDRVEGNMGDEGRARLVHEATTPAAATATKPASPASRSTATNHLPDHEELAKIPDEKKSPEPQQTQKKVAGCDGTLIHC